MHDAIDPVLVAWLPPSAPTVGASEMVALGVAQFIAAPAQAVATWRQCPRALHDVDALFCLGTAYAMGAGVSEDWRAAHSLFLKATCKGHAGAAFNAALLGLRTPIDRWAQRHFDRAPYETLAFLSCAGSFATDAALIERVDRLEETVRAAAPHAVAAAAKLAASIVRDARMYAPIATE